MKDIFIRTPILVPAANIVNDNIYSLEENSILVPDVYIHANYDVLNNTSHLNDTVNYPWEEKIEKAFMRGAPTSYMNVYLAEMNLMEFSELMDTSLITEEMMDLIENNPYLYPRLHACI